MAYDRVRTLRLFFEEADAETLMKDQNRSRAILMDLGMPKEDIHFFLDLVDSHRSVLRRLLDDGASSDLGPIVEEVTRDGYYNPRFVTCFLSDLCNARLKKPRNTKRVLENVQAPCESGGSEDARAECRKDRANSSSVAVNQPELTAKLYEGAAEQGDAEAQFKLARMYNYGRGVEQSYEEAVRWYRKAADQGEVHAQYNLGMMYYEGRGVEQSYEEAAKWYRKAAEQGDPWAQSRLGDMYREGKGVDKSMEDAIEWYKKAAEQGDSSALSFLKRLNAERESTKKSGRTVSANGSQTAGVYDTGSPYATGNRYYFGYGVEQSYEEAVKWYRKAAEQGDVMGELRLGDMYYTGQGVIQSYTRAISWYLKAAENGNATAQKNIGDMYRDGRGVEQSYEEAAKWYRKAAEQGDAEAQNNLDSITQETTNHKRRLIDAFSRRRERKSRRLTVVQGVFGNRVYLSFKMTI